METEKEIINQQAGISMPRVHNIQVEPLSTYFSQVINIAKNENVSLKNRSLLQKGIEFWYNDWKPARKTVQSTVKMPWQHTGPY